MAERAQADTYRILAEDCKISNNPCQSCNLNDMIMGCSGSGKSTGYILPNILAPTGSMIVTDTKSTLYNKTKAFLRKKGYDVELVDFKDFQSTIRYNPLQYVSYNRKKEEYAPQDIIRIAHILLPDANKGEIFWAAAARNYLTMLISFVLDFTPAKEHTLRTVMDLFRTMGTGTFETIMAETCGEHPLSYSARLYQETKSDQDADITYERILAEMSAQLSCLSFDAALDMSEHHHRFRFRDISKKKTALFLNIPDTDKSMEKLVNLLYSQAFHDLISFADESEGQRLPVPVRFLLDDFGNAYIEDFDNIISVIRSRGISVSIVIQSMAQLSSVYGPYKTGTILDNFSTLLFLGGKSSETVDYIAYRANVPAESVLNMSPDEAWLFTSGRLPRKVKKISPEKYDRYSEISGIEL